MEDKSSETLAAIVASFRVLGSNEKQAIKAMQILSKRKEQGDDFDFVSFIDKIVEQAPKLKITKGQNINSIFNSKEFKNIFNVNNR